MKLLVVFSLAASAWVSSAHSESSIPTSSISHLAGLISAHNAEISGRGLPCEGGEGNQSPSNPSPSPARGTLIAGMLRGRSLLDLLRAC